VQICQLEPQHRSTTTSTSRSTRPNHGLQKLHIEDDEMPILYIVRDIGHVRLREQDEAEGRGDQ
jgi:hypothetical protein